LKIPGLCAKIHRFIANKFFTFPQIERASRKRGAFFMHTEYDPVEIEKKWRRYWADTGLYRVDLSKTENKLYCLVMFSYPSSDRLHCGHWYNYAPVDTWCRFRKMQGANVFEPMGFDAFGLPAENYAVKTGVHPSETTRKNINFIREQLKTIGAMYDWDYEVVTCEKEYYKWTQWVFLKMWEKGLAYRKMAPVNWCPGCKTVLANEQVKDGKCDRCDSLVTKTDLEQWFFKITDYAERLLAGLDTIDWPEKTKAMQRNWIGRSEGAEIHFPLDGTAEKLVVFTTRADTLFGVTFMVLAPEHPLVSRITTPGCRQAVEAYVEGARRLTEIDRASLVREKTGVFTGACAVNPLSGEKIPIWIADYVLISYGTGAIMAVPGHDTRDREFAVKFKLPVPIVIRPEEGPIPSPEGETFTDYGIMVNSGPYTALSSKEGSARIIADLERKGMGKAAVNFKLRDWLISRQRYWGAPIPMVLCGHCGWVPVPGKDLPVELPHHVDFKPSGTGKSPLADIPGFVHAPCPRCGKPAERETDTMDTFVCSSWYFLRYVSPHDDTRPFDEDLANRWLPVDQYVGGAEHSTGHLLYSRFVTMVLKDMGYLKFEEPFAKLLHQGVITNQGARMSKSRGNVINPDPLVQEHGSDAFRMTLMFQGSYTDGYDWNENGIFGIRRFLTRVWRLFVERGLEPGAGQGGSCGGGPADRELLHVMHRTVKSVTEDLVRFSFNTAISRMMEFVNALHKYLDEVPETERNGALVSDSLRALNLLLAPFAPHLGEELWQRQGHQESVFLEPWPGCDENLARGDEVTIVVQIDGKVRAQFQGPPGMTESEMKEKALAIPKVQSYLAGKPVRKVITVPNRLVSIVR
jgi:leucyl-tRNA synthetase